MGKSNGKSKNECKSRSTSKTKANSSRLAISALGRVVRSTKQNDSNKWHLANSGS